MVMENPGHLMADVQYFSRMTDLLEMVHISQKIMDILNEYWTSHKNEQYTKLNKTAFQSQVCPKDQYTNKKS